MIRSPRQPETVCQRVAIKIANQRYPFENRASP